MADGTRLAARLWLPDELPAAVLLEALPYRMDDLTSSYASEYERLCEEGGFAVCRLDLRGTGSSEGIAIDEYHAAGAGRPVRGDRLARRAGVVDRARRHVRHVVGRASTRSRSRCERPPALGAIAPIYATDDRYTDDVHYMGGALQGARPRRLGALHGGAATCSRPCPRSSATAGATSGGGAIEGTEPWLLRWLEEQVDGPYWRHGSLRPRLRAHRLPDDDRRRLGRRVPRTTPSARSRALECPKRLLDRPVEPHVARDVAPRAAHRPRPGARPLVRRAGCATSANGVDEEPPIVVFVRRSTRPAPDLAGGARRVAGRARAGRSSASARGRAPARPARASTRSHDARRRRARARGSRARARLPWGQPERPARGRRALARLRVGAARGRARDARPSAAAADGDVAARRSRTSRRSSATSSRTGRRRSSRAGSSTSRTATATTTPSRSSRASRSRSRSSWRRRRGSSSRATASGSRSRAPTGRTSGRRRTAARSRSSARPSS